MTALKHLLSGSCLLLVALPAIGLLLSPQFSAVSQVTRDRSADPRIVQVQWFAAPRELTMVGALKPAETARVISRLGGRVIEVRAKPGDIVSVGTVVGVIRANALEDRLARYETAVREAENELRARQHDRAGAEKHLASRRELVDRDLIARNELNESQAGVDAARAAVELAQAHLAQQQAMLTQARALHALTEIRATVGGQVIDCQIKPGDALVEGATILTVGDRERWRFTGRIIGGAPAALRRGAAARISAAETDRVLPGEVTRIAEESDGSTAVEIMIADRQRIFRDGASVQARIQLEAGPDYVVVPRSAVITEQNSQHVYTFEQGRAVRREVTVGSIWETTVAVADGLSAGEFVYMDGQRELIRERRKRPIK